MSSRRTGRTTGVGRRGFALLTLAVVGALAFGTGLVGLLGNPPGSADGPAATPPPSMSARPSDTPTPSATPSDDSPRAAGAIDMPASPPKTMSIPAMNVDTGLQKLSKKGKFIELPKKAGKPGWFDGSATPGEPGISTVIGYIRKSESKPGVFARMKKLDKGDQITITRKDGREAIFQVDKIKSYSVKKFDAEEVYGLDERRAELRIITCGGTLDKDDPPSNVVVYAHLVQGTD